MPTDKTKACRLERKLAKTHLSAAGVLTALLSAGLAGAVQAAPLTLEASAAEAEGSSPQPVITVTATYPAPSVVGADAMSGASFDLSDIRALTFSEGELSGAASFGALAAENTDPARAGDFWIAFEETGTDSAFQQSVGPLLQALRVAFPERRVIISTFPSRDFVREATNRKIPFVIATSGTMVALMLEGGAVPLATREADNDAARPYTGGLLLTRADRKDITGLASLRGKRLSLQSTTSVSAWQHLQGRMIDEGLQAEGFFSQLLWRANDIPEVLNAVMYGHADAALLQSCVYERMLDSGLIDPKAFKTVAEYQDSDVQIGPSNDVPRVHESAEDANAQTSVKSRPGVCRSSTARYPDWAIGYTSSASNDALRRLAAAAFSLPPQQGFRWGLRADLSGVQKLMQTLHFGPYSYLDEQTPWGFVKRYLNVIIGVFAAFLVLLLHSLRANHLVRAKTAELQKALAARDEMEAQAKVSREQLSAIERIGMLSQMSSMFAHELKQPLASITNYIGGFKLWNKRRNAGSEEKEMTGGVLDAMGEEARRITAIVERVRGYAKARSTPLSPVDWTRAVRSAISIVERHDTKRVPIMAAKGEFFAADAQDDRPAYVLGDSLELELLALNMLRNAGHAAFEKRGGFVSVSITREDDGYVALRVTDNGPKLSPEAFARLTGYGESVKQEGLGIGLSICRGIVDRHGGSLHFYQLPIEGICAEVVLAAADKSDLAEIDGEAQKNEKDKQGRRGRK